MCYVTRLSQQISTVKLQSFTHAGASRWLVAESASRPAFPDDDDDDEDGGLFALGQTTSLDLTGGPLWNSQTIYYVFDPWNKMCLGTEAV